MRKSGNEQNIADAENVHRRCKQETGGWIVSVYDDADIRE